MDLGVVQLEKDDIILIRIDPEQMRLDEAQKAFTMLQDYFKDNKVIGYLKGSEVHIAKEKDITWYENLGEI